MGTFKFQVLEGHRVCTYCAIRDAGVNKMLYVIKKFWFRSCSNTVSREAGTQD